MTELAREYGDGLYALADEENLTAEVLEQMQALKACFREQPDFLRLLSNMSLSKDERVQILDGALRGQVHPYVLNFLKILCERGALSEYEGCVAAYTALYNQAHGITEASVTTAAPLGKDQRKRLGGKAVRHDGPHSCAVRKGRPLSAWRRIAGNERQALRQHRAPPPGRHPQRHGRRGVSRRLIY